MQIGTVFAFLNRPSTGRKYIAEIDGLRFLAILPVVLQHLSERMIRTQHAELQGDWEHNPVAYAVSRGSVGVLLFFAISGFILSLPFWKDAGRPRYLDYLKRRVLRIEPPYVFWMCCLALVLGIQATYPPVTLLQHLGASLLYIHTPVYGEFSIINPVAWSLEIEIQFYLLAPFMVGILRKLKPGIQRNILIPLGIGIYIGLMQLLGWNQGLLKFTLLGQLPYFMVGVWIAGIYKPEKSYRLLDILMLPAWIGMMYTWSESWWKTEFFVVCLALLFLGALYSTYFKRLLQLPFISVVGGMCYSIYLVHLALLEGLSRLGPRWPATTPYPVALVGNAVLWLPVVLIISLIAYVLIERPCMKPDWPLRLRRFLGGVFQRKTIAIKLFPLLLLGFPISGKTQSTGALPTPSPSESQDSLITVPLDTIFRRQDTLFWKGRAIAPLDTLIYRACTASPLLEVADLEIASDRVAIALKRRQWLQNISILSGADVGNGNVFSANYDGYAIATNTINRKTFQYFAGFNLRIPISTLTNRKLELEDAGLQLRKSILQKEIVHRQIAAEVAQAFYILKQGIRLLSLQTAYSESGMLKYLNVEKNFMEGQLSVEEFGKSTGDIFSMEMELEKLKIAIEEAYFNLQYLVGQSIH